jgi:hypothetical protein
VQDLGATLERAKGQIFLMFLFDKDEREDLTKEQKRSLCQALNVLKETRP